MDLKHLKETYQDKLVALRTESSHEASLLQVCVRTPLFWLFTSGLPQRAQQDLSPHPTVWEIKECAGRKEVGKSPCLAYYLSRLVLECPTVTCKPRHVCEVMSALGFFNKKIRSCCCLNITLRILFLSCMYISYIYLQFGIFLAWLVRQYLSFVRTALQEFLSPLLIFFSGFSPVPRNNHGAVYRGVSNDGCIGRIWHWYLLTA